MPLKAHPIALSKPCNPLSFEGRSTWTKGVSFDLCVRALLLLSFAQGGRLAPKGGSSDVAFWVSWFRLNVERRIYKSVDFRALRLHFSPTLLLSFLVKTWVTTRLGGLILVTWGATCLKLVAFHWQLHITWLQFFYYWTVKVTSVSLKYGDIW